MTVLTQRDDLGDDLTPSLDDTPQTICPSCSSSRRRRLHSGTGKPPPPTPCRPPSTSQDQIAGDGCRTLREHGEHAAADALPATCPYTFDQIIGDWLP